MPLNCGIPEEAWTAKEVNLNHMRIFGCISYVNVELDRRSKLDPKSNMCIFIGYGQASTTIDFGFGETKDPKA